MKCRSHIIILIIALLSFRVTIAQTDRQDRVEALRVSFITEKLSLSPQEAQAFWPLYNEYNDKIKTLRKNFRTQYKATTDFKNDKDAQDFLDAELKLKQSELDLHKEYIEGKIKKVLGTKKTALLRLAEEDFKRAIIKTVKGNSGD